MVKGATRTDCRASSARFDSCRGASRGSSLGFGAELGLVLADDFANWDATAKTGAHAVSATRLGHLEGLTAGARLRLSDMIAVGARGGLLLVGFPKASVEHEEGDDTGTYVIHPTDYRTKLWYSVMLSAEITVTD